MAGVWITTDPEDWEQRPIYVAFLGYFHESILKAYLFPPNKLSEMVNTYQYMGDTKQHCCQCPNEKIYKTKDSDPEPGENRVGGMFTACDGGKKVNCINVTDYEIYNFVTCAQKGSGNLDT